MESKGFSPIHFSLFPHTTHGLEQEGKPEQVMKMVWLEEETLNHSVLSHEGPQKSGEGRERSTGSNAIERPIKMKLRKCPLNMAAWASVEAVARAISVG